MILVCRASYRTKPTQSCALMASAPQIIYFVVVPRRLLQPQRQFLRQFLRRPLRRLSLTCRSGNRPTVAAVRKMPSVAADTGTCGFLASKNDCYPDNLGYCIAGGQKCCSVNVGALAGIIIGVLAAVIIPIVLCAMFLSCCKCCPCNKHNIKNSEAPRAGLVTGGVPTVSVVQHQLTSPVASKLTGVLSPLSQAEVIKGQNEALVGPTCTTRRHLGVLTVVSYMRTGLMRKGYRSKSSKEPERVRTIRI
eukprot:CAMPEP_0181182598 /NCGR_PEP_ID=MMETSP1096-20121128/7978_1 /TAXON_ID=156174 ORGANISM="Chrysochromulina ericina, Strain CCMP281" /NCGR_SAMPLE_ID=MMETSP1096 /ASSEMBLY_ACC=CAM_ASM_000453 /LENGTH=248 /DNA_ID=CAMNT_0023271223 /DNA_START=370 /DNA_END=1117 /DNA_ORIENTATION=+